VGRRLGRPRPRVRLSLIGLRPCGGRSVRPSVRRPRPRPRGLQRGRWRVCCQRSPGVRGLLGAPGRRGLLGRCGCPGRWRLRRRACQARPTVARSAGRRACVLLVRLRAGRSPGMRRGGRLGGRAQHAPRQHTRRRRARVGVRAGRWGCACGRGRPPRGRARRTARSPRRAGVGRGGRCGARAAEPWATCSLQRALAGLAAVRRRLVRHRPARPLARARGKRSFLRCAGGQRAGGARCRARGLAARRRTRRIAPGRGFMQRERARWLPIQSRARRCGRLASGVEVSHLGRRGCGGRRSRPAVAALRLPAGRPGAPTPCCPRGGRVLLASCLLLTRALWCAQGARRAVAGCAARLAALARGRSGRASYSRVWCGVLGIVGRALRAAGGAGARARRRGALARRKIRGKGALGSVRSHRCRQPNQVMSSWVDDSGRSARQARTCSKR